MKKPWVCFILTTFLFAASAGAADSPRKVIFRSPYYSSMDDFERFAVLAKSAGATHISISDDLPRSLWQYDTEGDPYPGWTVTQMSLLKVAPPPKLKEFIPADYTTKVMAVLVKRCQILRRLGMKAFISVTEPAMLPEAVYERHPAWRGPIVSHPARSTVTRFAPSTDHPEVQQLYRESMALLLKQCPEIAIIVMLTNDSGAGIDWSTGLYNGRIGNTRFADIRMETRVRTFFDALWAGAKDAGSELDLNIRNTRESDPLRIVRSLTTGMAIDGLEGPDGRRFSTSASASYGFSPVYGIPQYREYIDGFASLARDNSHRWIVSINDHVHRELLLALYRKVIAQPPTTERQKLDLLAQFGEEQIGPGKGDQFIELADAIDRVARQFNLLDTGGYLFELGCVHQRWLIRPFVPFPEELPASVTATWRRFQFQAVADRINNLADLQATDTYYGWSGKHLVDRITASMSNHVGKAIRLATDLGDHDLARRLRIFDCVMANANGAISFQAQLDRVHTMQIKPLKHVVVQTQSDWDRQMMMATARREIDNTVELIELLQDNPAGYLRMAATPAEEDISLLGPNFISQLQLKLKIMNAHWEDYKRMFSTPNL